MLKIFILSLLVLNPKHPLNNDEKELNELVQNIEFVADKYTIDASLIAYFAFMESSLKFGKTGKLGEIGYGQIHGKAGEICKKVNYDINNKKGNLLCMGMLIDMGIRYCGSIEKGLTWYACGNCKGSPRTQKKIKFRLNDWSKKWKSVKF